MALHHRSYRLLLDTDSTSTTSTTSPGDMNRSFTATSDSNFDTNMVFILAALLSALIFALGLNSIVRCCLGCSQRYAFETPDESISGLGSKGLKKSALGKIPIAVYGSGVNSITSFAATDCPICLGEFMDGEKVRVLPICNHGFHVMCVDKWLLLHSSCPTCRQSLLEYPTSSQPSSSVVVNVDAAVGTTNQRV